MTSREKLLENERMPKYVYGPVLSRRLGYSLGVDIIPYKVCSFDCIYCQLGRTTHKTVERKHYMDKDEILRQIESAVSSVQRIDYITFSGSGEPSLNSAIGTLIKEIKKKIELPVAVLTNSSLLYDEQTRRELLSADLLLPSLDAGQEGTFKKINRPYPSLHLDEIIMGLRCLRKEYRGQIWLELMLVRGINNTREEIELLRRFIAEINPDKVQLNTVIRPPSEESAELLTLEELVHIRSLFGTGCEIIPHFAEKRETIHTKNSEETILTLIKRRPLTLSEITSALGIHREEAIKYLEILKRKKSIKVHIHRGLEYYEPY